jgi:hypothetical protein
LKKNPRKLPPAMMRSAAMLMAETVRVMRPRHHRNVGRGEQRRAGLPHAPSLEGPSSQAPPGRVHFQRPFVSPGLTSKTGAQSAVAPQLPRRSGPSRHALPSQA